MHAHKKIVFNPTFMTDTSCFSHFLGQTCKL